MFNKKLIAGLFVAIVIAVPFSAKAVSIEDLQAQISSLLALVASLQQQLSQTVSSGTQVSTPVPTIQCENFTYNLYLGKRDNTTNGEVTKLQRFLTKTGDYNSLIGGYFGPATERAVQSWQRKHNVVSSGTPDSTGYGVVGPKTREKMQCETVVPIPPYTSIPTIGIDLDNDVIVCAKPSYCDNEKGFPEGVPEVCTNGKTTTAGKYNEWYRIWQAQPVRHFGKPQFIQLGACTLQNNQPPTIHSFSGPTILRVNQIGTWSLKVDNPQNNQLTYSIKWGDEYLYNRNLSSNTIPLNNFVQYTTFTHKYTRPGTYTVSITIQSDLGEKAETTMSVTVRDIIPVTPRIKLNDIYSIKLSDPIQINWSMQGDYGDMGMYIVLRDINDNAIKSIKVNPGDLNADININKFCNNFFGDVIDANCSSLKNRLAKGVNQYYIEAALFKPKNACFGYCPNRPGAPQTQIVYKVKSNIFSITSSTICTTEYDPVCGLPVFECPTGAVCNKPIKVTYSNMCKLKAANATFISKGECKLRY